MALYLCCSGGTACSGVSPAPGPRGSASPPSSSDWRWGLLERTSVIELMSDDRVSLVSPATVTERRSDVMQPSVLYGSCGNTSSYSAETRRDTSTNQSVAHLPVSSSKSNAIEWKLTNALPGALRSIIWSLWEQMKGHTWEHQQYLSNTTGFINSAATWFCWCALATDCRCWSRI